MAYYYYTVLGTGGNAIHGVSDVPDMQDHEARAWLKARLGGLVVRLVGLPAPLGAAILFVSRVLGKRLAPAMVAGMLRDMALMTGAGIPILEAVSACLEEAVESRNRLVARCLVQLRTHLQTGASVADAFGRQRNVFPETVRSLVTIGDETGTMEKMLMESADHIERVLTMRANARQALIYPAFVFVSIFGAAAFWIYYVIPNLKQLFMQMNVQLPALTVAVLAGGNWAADHFAVVAWSALLGALVVYCLWSLSQPFRALVFAALHRLPVSSALLKGTGLAFFCEYLSILIRAGLDVARSMAILERTLTDDYYRSRVGKMQFYVERGEKISSAMRRVGGFPRMITRVIAVGENSGTLDQQLDYLAQEYRTRLVRLIASMSEIIKPLIIVLAGALFIFIVVALFLPIYSLIRQTLAHQM
ncbi:type II secretion system F family protein [Paraburkholderia heleia]|uniref:type II secretion system F family protein n=1 Tax=Paraburkholderia heleia TaxID=634127 RepID=UPI002AB766D4|nr:type II secretion system F family protein [Paraburkholderia heleia]